MPIALFDRNETPLDVSFLGFSGGERHVQLGAFDDVKDYVIRAYLRSSDDVFDLLLLGSALNEKFENPRLYIDIPYLPYARQDRVCAPGQAFSLKVLSGLLAQIENVKDMAIWDCHSPVGIELTGAKNVPAQDIINASPALVQDIVDVKSVIICPDKGAVSRTQAIAAAFAKDMQDNAIVYCEKVRDPASGQITHTDVKAASLEGMTAIITDDICDGGYTFIKIAEQLKAKGADRVILFVTHGIFSKGLGVFDGLIDHIYTSASFEHAPDPRLTVIDFGHAFGIK